VSVYRTAPPVPAEPGGSGLRATQRTKTIPGNSGRTRCVRAQLRGGPGEHILPQRTPRPQRRPQTTIPPRSLRREIPPASRPDKAAQQNALSAEDRHQEKAAKTIGMVSPDLPPDLPDLRKVSNRRLRRDRTFVRHARPSLSQSPCTNGPHPVPLPRGEGTCRGRSCACPLQG